jgi:hypothetical protein
MAARFNTSTSSASLICNRISNRTFNELASFSISFRYKVLAALAIQTSGGRGSPSLETASMEPRIFLGRHRPEAHHEGLSRARIVHEGAGVDSEIAYSGVEFIRTHTLSRLKKEFTRICP